MFMVKVVEPWNDCAKYFELPELVFVGVDFGFAALRAAEEYPQATPRSSRHALLPHRAKVRVLRSDTDP